jgi:hypothetical protein
MHNLPYLLIWYQPKFELQKNDDLHKRGLFNSDNETMSHSKANALTLFLHNTDLALKYPLIVQMHREVGQALINFLLNKEFVKPYQLTGSFSRDGGGSTSHGPQAWDNFQSALCRELEIRLARLDPNLALIAKPLAGFLSDSYYNLLPRWPTEGNPNQIKNMVVYIKSITEFGGMELIYEVTGHADLTDTNSGGTYKAEITLRGDAKVLVVMKQKLLALEADLATNFDAAKAKIQNEPAVAAGILEWKTW